MGPLPTLLLLLDSFSILIDYHASSSPHPSKLITSLVARHPYQLDYHEGICGLLDLFRSSTAFNRHSGRLVCNNLDAAARGERDE